MCIRDSSAAGALHSDAAGAPPAPDASTTVEVWRRTRLRDQFVGDESATPFDRYHNLDPSRPSATRGCARIASAVTVCVEINQCVGCTPSSRHRVDGVEDDATIQHEGAVNF